MPEQTFTKINTTGLKGYQVERLNMMIGNIVVWVTQCQKLNKDKADTKAANEKLVDKQETEAEDEPTPTLACLMKDCGNWSEATPDHCLKYNTPETKCEYFPAKS